MEPCALLLDERGVTMTESSMAVLQKITNRITHDPAILLLGIYPRKIKAESQRDICFYPHSEKYFHGSQKGWMQPKCSCRDEWLSKCIY